MLSPTEVAATLTALAGHRLHPIVATFLGTGIRRGELCGLQWADIDLDKATLKVERSLEETRAGVKLKPPKTKNGRRTMSLPSVTVEVLQAHRKAALEHRLRIGLGRPAPDDPVFTLPDGDYWGPDYLSRVWQQAVNKLKLPKVTLHALRHTHASTLIRGKVDLITVARRLGHASAAFTLQVYGHLIDRDDTTAAQAIDAVFAAT